LPDGIQNSLKDKPTTASSSDKLVKAATYSSRLISFQLNIFKKSNLFIALFGKHPIPTFE
jgi:hypothetical protein